MPATAVRGKPQKDGKVQTYIQGTEPKRIAEIDKAAKEYRTVMLQRVELLESEKKLKEKLTGLMKKHKQKKYESKHDLVVTLKPKDATATVTVKPIKRGDDDD